MAFKLADYECKKCEQVVEVLCEGDEVPKCETCKKKMKKVISIGSGKGSHQSWSAWRADLAK